MSSFSAHRLWFEGRAESQIVLGPHQGSAIRGALFHALRGRPGRPAFCLEPQRQECLGCILVASCPVSFLLSTVNVAGRRGSDVPRPYTIEPPLDHRGTYEPGQPFRFGITLFARSLNLFPYVIVAVRRMEEEGIGRRLPAGPARGYPGRFRIGQIIASNPLTGEDQLILQQGQELVKIPNIPVTHQQVLSRAAYLQPCHTLTLEFLSPARLVEAGRTLRQPLFRPLIQRLLERLSSLWEEYGGEELPIDFDTLMEKAGRIRLVDDHTEWAEVRGYSTRQNTPKYLDGFLGRATYEGDFGPFLPWLVWGEQTHVGKDAVKGCGMYRIADSPGPNRLAGRSP